MGAHEGGGVGEVTCVGFVHTSNVTEGHEDMALEKVFKVSNSFSGDGAGISFFTCVYALHPESHLTALLPRLARWSSAK